MFSRKVLRTVRAAAPQRAAALRVAVPVRSFAAAATSEVKPPVSVFGVDGTYATALVNSNTTPPPRASRGSSPVDNVSSEPNWHRDAPRCVPGRANGSRRR
jgi:hypothetical protein